MIATHRPADGRPDRSLRSFRAWAVLLFVLIGGLTLDIWSKYATFEYVAGEPVELNRDRILQNGDHNPIPRHEGRTVLPGGLLDFRLVINHGAVFGIGQEQRGFFIAFTAIAIVVGLFAFAMMTTPGQWLAHIGIGLVLAGGIGNLYDRIVYGVVRDFLHMLPDWHLPFGLTWFGGAREVFPWVFNIADVLLLTGMALLLFHFYRIESQHNGESKADRAGTEADEGRAHSNAAAE